MRILSQNERDNLVRWNPASAVGHYESFFLKANSPDRRCAFWLKFTILSPIGQPDQAVGELWAIAFDSDTGRNVAVKERYTMDKCRLGFEAFDIQIGGASLGPGVTRGTVSRGDDRIEWDLQFLTEQQTSLHPFPFEKMYELKLPKAKLLTPYPDSRFSGWLTVNGERWECDYWKGMQGHNWGVRHTDHYLWLQCSAFDGLDDTFLEGASAKLKLGPVTTPYLTFFCLTYRGQQIHFNQLTRLLSNKCQFTYFTWRFEATSGDWRLEGEVDAPRSAFVGLHYENPDGSLVDCLNSKIANCRAILYRKVGDAVEVVAELNSERAAFEILTDAGDHGIPIYA